MLRQIFSYSLFLVKHYIIAILPKIKIATRLTKKRKAQTIAIRLLGSPQATIHYGKSAPEWVQFSQHVLVYSSFQSFEVVIQKAAEL